MKKRSDKSLGYIGLGKMGKNMVLRLLQKDWNIVAYNRTRESVEEVKEKGATGAKNIAELVVKLSPPRAIWIMVPYDAVEEVIHQLSPLLEKGDMIVNGANSPYQESEKTARELAQKGIEFLDIGVSGGPGGMLSGSCMYVGGKKELYDRLDQAGLFTDMCVPGGYGLMGPHGAGHFVKMVHNGIEYGMMQSIAEGFDLLRHSHEFDFDPEKIVDVYSHGSVIASSLISWMSDGYKKFGKDLNEISGRASATGEGKWTVEAGMREGIPMPAIEAALESRELSQLKPSYQGKVVSTMRGEFGQHPVKRGNDEPEVL